MPDVIVAPDIDHSPFGASAAYRWRNCKGSIELVSKMEDDQPGSSWAADEGSAAHELGAHCLNSGDEPWMLIGTEIEIGSRRFMVDQEMADGVMVYVEHVRAKVDQHADKHVEVFVELSMQDSFFDQLRGTTDSGIVVRKTKRSKTVERIIVTDLKYGYVTVEPDSDQNKYYARLFVQTIEDKIGKEVPDDVVIELWIAQPRAPHDRGPLRLHVTNVGEIKRWWDDELIPDYAEAQNTGNDLHMGDWCRFCPAKERCPAMHRDVEALNADLDPVALTDDVIGALLAKRKAIEGFLAALQAEAFKRMMAGGKVPGMKLVKKRADRTYKDGADTHAKELFGDDAMTTPSLLSPAQLEKTFGKEGKEFTKTWAYSPDVGLTSAPVSDKRKEFVPAMDALDALDSMPDEERLAITGE